MALEPTRQCPRCKLALRVDARFCSQCGLAQGRDTLPGSVVDPNAMTAPSGCRRVEGAADIHYRTRAPGGGSPLISTEGVELLLFNAGYGLRDVTLRLVGRTEDGRQVTIERSIPQLDKGEDTCVELPSYELNAPLKELRVELASAEFLWE